MAEIERCAVYARYSDERQNPLSIDQQIRKCREYAERHDLYVLDASVRETAANAPKTLTDAKVDLKDWSFAVVPADEYLEMLLDAWRLHRDYFYDRKMHGVDWKAVRKKYEPLVDRVASRGELADLTAQMVSELSALHIFVVGGEHRRGVSEGLADRGECVGVQPV